ncbi:MAG TPA: acyl-CoA dehydrogenase family protein [Acidimicrobiales bacterium]|nr:acyl-CoA dehydrogenase family protein [Acidimicrobiales bacterium]
MSDRRPETGGDAVAFASRFADEVLFPSALDTESAGDVPTTSLDALAAAGLYGMAGPVPAGGLDLDRASGWAVVEALAGGCLATAFVWVQHHGLVRMLASAAPGELRDEWLGPLCRGERRAGLALAGLLPGPARLRATPRDEGWALQGSSPWVTGWGHVDVLLVAARAPDDMVAWLVVDAVEGGGLTVERQRLVAVDASATVRADFDGLVVPRDRLIAVQPCAEVAGGPAASLRTNGSLALGVAGRCCRLMGPSGLGPELAHCRAALDAAGPEEIADARAAASELAVRAASALVVHEGSSSVTLGASAQRLAREATFLLVFGSRPAIRAALLRRLGAG